MTGYLFINNFKMNKTEKFIDRARKTHGDRYDYSKVEYVNAKTKVCIICHEHGEFWQDPSKHIKGNNCPKCARIRKTKEDVINEFKSVHGDKYDYSKVKYVNNTTKVCIICPEHGEFWQTPKDHLRGNACSKCSGRFMDKDYFIEKATKIHNGKYDYSKVEYEYCNKNVCIICPEHGEFWQLPSNHLKGEGCLKCAHSKKTKKREAFINELKSIYGEKYDYTKIEYKNTRTKVCIICPEHGEFWQVPISLLRGNACPYCSGYRSNDEIFIEKFKNIYGDKYDTSKIKYINSTTKVCVVCHEKDIIGKEHGEFWATPSSLLHGCSCPKCGNVYKYGTEEFIEKANFIHNNKYDYSKTNYKKNNVAVEIICHEKDSEGNEHGLFLQTPNDHLQGHGCPKCALIKRGLSTRKTFEEFIKEAREVHGDRYDYLEYEKFSSKAKMYCHEEDEFGVEHGEFWQLPSNHLKGRGCPKCRKSHLEERVEVFLKKNEILYTREQKFEFLKKRNYLPIDFYLKEYKIGIECQGKQHFTTVNFGGKISNERQLELLEIQKENDRFKKTKCEENGITVFYINYNDNFEEKFSELMKLIKDRGVNTK